MYCPECVSLVATVVERTGLNRLSTRLSSASDSRAASGTLAGWDGRYNLPVKRFEYLSEGDGDRPFFRSDAEARPDAPVYKPLRPEGGPWIAVKRVLAPLGLAYFGLISLLALVMAATFVPDPTVLR